MEELKIVWKGMNPMKDSLPNMDEVVRQKIDELIGHNGTDGTYIYCLTRCKSAFNVGTMTLDDFVEVNEEFTEDFVDLFMELNRLLIEERESHGPEGRNYTNAQYVELRLKLEQESIKVAEQDKEIQRYKEGWEVIANIPMSVHPSEMRSYGKKMLNGETPYKL